MNILLSRILKYLNGTLFLDDAYRFCVFFILHYQNFGDYSLEEVANEFEKAISLRVIDTHWMNHINTMSHLREGIGLRSYAQENPLRAYTNEGFELYDELLNTIDQETTMFLLKSEIRQNIERKQVVKGKAVTDNNKTKKATPKRVNKIGRNDPCPCGSGKKYKQCCGK